LNELVLLFLNNLFPLFLIAGAGFLLRRWLHVDPRSLSQVSFYIFSPSLIFNLIRNSQLEGPSILVMVLYALMIAAVMGLLAFAVGRMLGLDRTMLAAVVLCAILVNAGNYGLPVILFAFNEETLAYATLYFLANVILTYTVGVFIASIGRTSIRGSLINLVQIPGVWALLLGVLFLQTDWSLPLPVERTVDLLSGAAIPSMVLLLGLQISGIRIEGKIKPLVAVNVLRLLVSPALALALAALFGMKGASLQAGVIESAMPSAVMTTILAIQYDVDPAFVAAAVFTTTILSPFTLTPLMAFLGG
jgi:predicted permease